MKQYSYINPLSLALSASILIFSGCSNVRKKSEGLKSYDEISTSTTELLARKRDHEIAQYKMNDALAPEYGILNSNNSMFFYSPKYLSLEAIEEIIKNTYTDRIVSTSYIPESNQIIIRPKSSEILEPLVTKEELKSFLSKIDKKPPQIEIEAGIYKVFAEKSSDISALLKAQSQGELRPSLDIDLRGLRNPSRDLLISQTGISGAVGEYMLKAVLDSLVSEGHAIQMAHQQSTVMNSKKTMISKIEKIPIEQVQITSSGQTITTVRYEPIVTSLEVTVRIVANGHVNLKLAVEAGDLQQQGTDLAPVITQRKTEIDEIRVKQRRTVAIASFINENQFASMNKAPPLSEVPLISNLFKGKKFGNERDVVIYLITPIIKE